MRFFFFFKVNTRLLSHLVACRGSETVHVAAESLCVGRSPRMLSARMLGFEVL